MSPEIVPKDDLYFIQSESGRMKIGRATNVRKRKSSLQCGCFERLEIVATLQGRGYEEKVWHAAFGDHRLSGEWFDPRDGLTEAIELAAKGQDWWDHLYPPTDFEWLGETEDELQEGVEDWHIAIIMTLAALRVGERPPLRDPNEMFEFAEGRMLAFIEAQGTHNNARVSDKER